MIKDTAMKSHRLADSSGQKSHSFIFFSNTHKTLLMPTKMISEYIHIGINEKYRGLTSSFFLAPYDDRITV